MATFIDVNGQRYSLSASGNFVGIDADGNRFQFNPSGVATNNLYRLAVYGDSRVNVTTTHIASAAASSSMNGEKAPVQLCMLRGDMQIVFNGGISGDTAANWNSASRISSSQDVKSLLATTPDLCYIQYGVNDCIAGTAAATIYGNLKSLIAKIIGGGVPVVFESINTCAVGPVSYINSYSSSGGFSGTSIQSEADTELAILQAVNAEMRSWLGQFPPSVAVYVDTSSVTAGSNGFAKTDKTYYDGTHVSRTGARAIAALIDNAISAICPRINRLALRPGIAYANGCNFALLSPSSGRASDFAAIASDAGSMTSTYEIGVDSDGMMYQQYNVNVSALSSSRYVARFDIQPDFDGASPFTALTAGDIIQGCVDYYIDNGSGGAPSSSNVYLQPRFYYDDASNQFTNVGPNQQLASTDYPAMSVESGRLLAPRLAVKAGLASANMTTGTAMQLIVIGNATGDFRLRVKNPQWMKVA